MVSHTDEDGVWEIMLCDVKQYALSRQRAEHLDTRKSSDWYTRYLEIMSHKARRIGGIRHGLSLSSWRKLRSGSEAAGEGDELSSARGA